jgi:hypothetical protein
VRPQVPQRLRSVLAASTGQAGRVMRAGAAALELLALCVLIVIVGMLSPRLTPTAAGVIAAIGAAGLVVSGALIAAFARRLAEREAARLAGVPVPVAAVRRLGFPLVALGFFLLWTLVYMALWAVHPEDAFRGLAAMPRFADFFYYAVSTAFISPPGDIIAVSRGARSATMIEMLSGASLVTVYLSGLAAFPRPGARESADASAAAPPAEPGPGA